MSAIRKAAGAIAGIFKGRQPGARLFGFAGNSEAGMPVGDDAAMRFAAVQACVRVLSEDVAALPIHVLRRTPEGGKERVRGHPLYSILHDAPNPEMTAISFWEAMMVNLLLGGNAYAFIEYDRTGRIRGLWPLLHSEVSPFRSENGEILYRIAGKNYRSSEILHVTGLSFDGLLGLSPIAYARESIGLGMAAERFGARFFGNGTHIGGVISIPGELSDEARDRTVRGFSEAYKGLQNAHGIPILEGGAKFERTSIAPEDAQFLETRKFQRTEIAAIFRVPLHLIGDLERATFSNIEHQDQGYLQRSLLPWLMRIEQSATQKLLTENERKRFLIEHDTGNFLKGDTKSRFEAYALGIQNGILTPNEVRAKENLNPIEGYDELLIPLNMQSASQSQEEDRPEVVSIDEIQKRYLNFPTDGARRAVSDVKDAATDRMDFADKAALRLEPFFASWLKLQAADILRAVKKVYGVRSAGEIADLRQLLQELYRDYGEAPSKALRDKIVEIAEEARKKACEEIGVPYVKGDGFDKTMQEYARKMARRLNGANYGKLTRILDQCEESGEDVPDRFYSQMKDWGTARAKRMAEYESTRIAAVMAEQEFTARGYQVLWASNPGCCQSCQRLNNRPVTTLRPPLHKGCKCTVRAGEKLTK